MIKNVRKILPDASTLANLTITYVHHEIHSGKLFMGMRWDTLAAGDTIAIAMTTPNTDVAPHLDWEIYGSGAVTLDLFRDVTSYTGGTALVPMNHNDRSSNTSGMTVEAGSDGVLVDPIVITGGSQHTMAAIGAGNKSSSDGGSRYEFIVAKNEITIWRLTAVGNNIRCGLTLHWYEHTDKG